MVLIPALKRLRPDDCELDKHLGHKVRPVLTTDIIIYICIHISSICSWETPEAKGAAKCPVQVGTVGRTGTTGLRAAETGDQIWCPCGCPVRTALLILNLNVNENDLSFPSFFSQLYDQLLSWGLWFTVLRGVGRGESGKQTRTNSKTTALTRGAPITGISTRGL